MLMSYAVLTDKVINLIQKRCRVCPLLVHLNQTHYLNTPIPEYVYPIFLYDYCFNSKDVVAFMVRNRFPFCFADSGNACPTSGNLQISVH